LLKVFWFLIDSKLMESVVVFEKGYINSLKKQPEGWVSDETKSLGTRGLKSQRFRQK